MAYRARARPPRQPPSNAPTTSTAKVCPVIGTGVKPRGTLICAKRATSRLPATISARSRAMRRTPAESGRMISASVAGNLAAGLGAEVAWVCMVRAWKSGSDEGGVRKCGCKGDYQRHWAPVHPIQHVSRRQTDGFNSASDSLEPAGCDKMGSRRQRSVSPALVSDRRILREVHHATGRQSSVDQRRRAGAGRWLRPGYSPEKALRWLSGISWTKRA